MGKSGTDVAREASHMVLLDDNFATIVEAVSEGRRIFDNIRKFIRYTMTSNSGEIWTLFLAPFLGMPLPLLPVHILWINLVTDGLPGLALSLERKEPHIMKRPPRPPNEAILSGGMPWHILWIGLLIGGLSLATQALALGTDNPHWQTMVFTVLTFTQLCHVLAIRSERLSLFSRGFSGNPALLASIVVTVILQLGVIYIPVLQALFKLQPLSASELLYCVLVSMLVIPAVELEKRLARQGVIYTKRHVKSNTLKRS
jgi:Ca2+-transporting ATPase